MSLNGKKVSEFTADAYLNGEFVKVSDKDLQGKWSVLFFYPADFTFVCPTELEDLQRLYGDFKKKGARFIPCPAIPTLCTKPGMTLRKNRQGYLSDDWRSDGTACKRSGCIY